MSRGNRRTALFKDQSDYIRLLECVLRTKELYDYKIHSPPALQGDNSCFSKEDERLLAWRERTDVIDREIALCGYFVLITSESMTAEEAINLYKSRDVSGKLFRGDKSYMGARAERGYVNESLETKLFIEFIVCGFVMIAAIISYFAGVVLKTIYQKNRQDFEMDLYRVTSEMKLKMEK